MLTKKILIVEDCPMVLKSLIIRLERAGYEVISAVDGEEGLKKAREEDPDLIVLDLMLPKLSGYQLCRLIKFDEEYEHIPVVMLTARSMDNDKDLGLKVGADAYMTKPYHAQELLATIERLIEGKFMPNAPYLF